MADQDNEAAGAPLGGFLKPRTAGPSALPALAASPFCGREDELERLMAAWREVSKGASGPRTVVLVAEPGLGKTRLVQELYARVAEEAAPGAGRRYWPARLAQEGENLAINPDPQACDHAAPLPFMWWGVRLADPGGHDRLATGALPGHVEAYLVPQLEPLHREQRRRQSRAQLLRLGGSVAADFAVDAVASVVPGLGLLKKAAEVGAELRGIHAAYRKDAAPFDAEAFGAARRASLVDSVIGDLGALFGGPAGRRVPGVIVIDDAQFAHADPTMLGLVGALADAMTEGGWPLLLVVTHWEREWAQAERELEGGGQGASAAARLLGHARGALGAVVALRLRPVPAMGKVVEEGLPGLAPAQRDALLQRAGGNPRLLEEIVRYARSPRAAALFEGHGPAAALSARGLEELLRRSTRFEELVGDRLAGAPEAVQQSIALAAIQGSDFVDRLAALTAEGLTGDAASRRAVSAGLAEAAVPHAYVEPTGGGLSAFRQRAYLHAARQLLAGLMDEETALEAHRDALRTAITDYATPYEPAELLAIAAQAAAAFEEASDVADLRLAAAALDHLMRATTSQGDLLAAAANARRLIGVVERLPDEALDAELAWLTGPGEALEGVGLQQDLGARSRLLQRLLRLTGEAREDDANAWSVRMYVTALLQVVEYHREQGSLGRADEALMEAAAAIAALPAEEHDLAMLGVARAVYDALGDRHLGAGDVADARLAFEHALRLAEAAAHEERHEEQAARPSTGVRWALAVARRKLGRCAQAADDLSSAAEHLTEAVALLRAMSDETDDPDAAVSLAAALDSLAAVRAAQGADDEATSLLTESYAMASAQHAAAPGARRARANLADSCELLALHHEAAGRDEEAWAYALQAVDLRRSVDEDAPSAVTRSDLGYASTIAARLAWKLRRLDEAELHSSAAVSLQLAFAPSAYPPAPAAWRRLIALEARLPVVWNMQGEGAARAVLLHVDGVVGELGEEQLRHVRGVLEGFATARSALASARGREAS